MKLKSVKSQKPIVVYFIFGAVLLFLFGISAIFLKSFWMVYKAQDWVPVTCVIQSAEVERVEASDSDSSDTFKIKVSYAYHYNGNDYQSTRYGFLGGSSSGSSGKQETVDKLNQAGTVICFVNPDDPSEAVIERGLTWEFAFVLIPFVFILIFGSVFYLALGCPGSPRKRSGKLDSIQKRIESITAAYNGSVVVSESELDDTVLKPVETLVKRKYKFVGYFVFGIFWTTILTIIICAEGNGIPIELWLFIAVAVFIFGKAFYELLASWNPELKVKMAPVAVRCGNTLRLEWRLEDRKYRVKMLTVSLIRSKLVEGKDRDDKPHWQEAQRLMLFERSSAWDIQNGYATVTIPDNLMPSDVVNCRWEIQFHGSVPYFPDINDCFPIRILGKQSR